MQYQVAQIPLNDHRILKKLPISKQSAIERRFGKKLILPKVIHLIEEGSNGFKDENAKALEADQLLIELITSKGYQMPAPSKSGKKPKAQPSQPKSTPPPAKGNKVEQLRKAIKGLETTMKFTSGDKKDMIAKAIKGLEIVLKLESKNIN